MKQTSKIIYSFLVFSMFLASCGPVPVAPTATSVPTRTPLPTTTSIPETSATAALSPVEKEFMIPTRQVDFVDTPTPIATPEFGSSSIKLKDLAEQDFLNLMYEMNRYSYQNYPSLYGDWWTDGLFVSSQESVALAIQEYLYRFPQSPHAERLRWQLAFIHSIGYEPLPGNDYDEEWLITRLQEALDRGTITPGRLEDMLDKYWFDVAYVQRIENLFADGKTGILYVIAPQVWADSEDDPKLSDYLQYGGLFVVVRESQPGNFQVLSLKNAWNFSYAESHIYEISDHNQNGVPEIALYIGSHSGTMCSGKLLIYEWSKDAFLELTKGNIYRQECGEEIKYSTVKNIPAITFYGFMPARTEQYVWDGEYYVFAGYESESLVDKWWAVTGSFHEEAKVIEALLFSSEDDGLSPSQIDFLRLRLGIVSALNHDSAKARQVLQDVVDHPADETRTIYADLSKNFLQNYTDDKSLLLACRKSQEMLDIMNDSTENEEDLFGIPFDFIFGTGLLRCFDRDVLELLVTKIPVTAQDVPAELRKYGVNLQNAEKQDVNLDGIRNEWLIAFDMTVFAVTPMGDYYQAIYLGDFWYDEKTQPYASVEIRVEQWKGIEEPILVIRSYDELSIHLIGDDYHSTELSFDFDVKDVLFAVDDAPPGYQVLFTKPGEDEEYYGGAWTGYRWDSDHQDFRADLIEHTLFIQHDPQKALEIAELVTPSLMEWRDSNEVDYWLPRYFYLCGLTYELSGDKQTAAELYWQIWHDFPESPYSLMARYKLEPANP